MLLAAVVALKYLTRLMADVGVIDAVTLEEVGVPEKVTTVSVPSAGATV